MVCTMHSFIGCLIKFAITNVILAEGEGEKCLNNNNCTANLLCDRNLKTCRKHAHDQDYSSSFCSSNGRLCQEMEGDCDSDDECEGSLKCGKNNCDQSDWSSGADCCFSSGSSEEGVSCTMDSDCPGSLVCGNHDQKCRTRCAVSGCCSQGIIGFCQDGEGDCDTHSECMGDLLCGENNCEGLLANDCCRQPQGDEGKNCTINNECSGSLVCGNHNHKCRPKCTSASGSYCCSQDIEGYCQEGEGDCDHDWECQGSLVCGSNNCHGPGFHSSDDCCRRPQEDVGKSCTTDNECVADVCNLAEDAWCSGALVCGNHDHKCRQKCDGGKSCCSQDIIGFCNEGEGDCDTHSECYGHLVCGSNNCIGSGFREDHNDCCRQPQGDEGKYCRADSECSGFLVCGNHDHKCRKKCAGPGCCSENIAGFCKEGEGDCDDDWECEGSLVCGNKNCPWSSGHTSIDDCCYQRERDEGKDCTTNSECSGSLVCGNHDKKCRQKCTGTGTCCSHEIEAFCQEGEGDCDKDWECEGSLVCGYDNCIGPGFDIEDDCCRQLGKNCTTNDDCSGSHICGPNDHKCRPKCAGQGPDCCSQAIEGFCQEGEGDCDYDWECQGSLICGKDNCREFGIERSVDCCMQPDCSNLNEEYMFEAAEEGKIEEIVFVINCNTTDINSVNSDGKTPLYLAAEEGGEKVVELLLAHKEIHVNKGIMEKHRENAGQSPLYIASENGHAEVVKLLLDHPEVEVNEGRNSDGRTPLYNAARGGYYEVVKLILAHKEIDVNKGTDHGPWAGKTPLYGATSHNHLKIVRLFLSHSQIDVNKGRKNDGINPLLLAVWYVSEGHQEEIVEVLLQHPSIKVNQQRHSDGATPLSLAAFYRLYSGIQY